MKRATALALLLVPGVAQACAVCGQGSGLNRSAFLITTIILSLLPLGMIAGGLWWLVRHARLSLAEEFHDRDATAPPPREA